MKKTGASGLNRTLLSKLLVTAVVMFGFAYALNPFYRQICEALGLNCLLYTSPSPRDGLLSRMPSSA